MKGIPIPFTERCGFSHDWRVIRWYRDGTEVKRCVVCKVRWLKLPMDEARKIQAVHHVVGE